MNTSHFYPELSMVFPQFPNLSFDRALNIAARTLCRIGLVWRTELEEVEWEVGEREYFLFLPTNTRCVDVLQLGDLVVTTAQRLAAADPEWLTRVGSPRFYYRDAANTVAVYPVPGSIAYDPAVPLVALAPMEEGKVLSDDYAWDYERLLLQGASAHLGVGSWAQFEYECHVARSRATDNNQIGVARAVRYAGY